MQRPRRRKKRKARAKGSRDTDRNGRVEQLGSLPRERSKTACPLLRSSLSRAPKLLFFPQCRTAIENRLIESQLRRIEKQESAAGAKGGIYNRSFCVGRLQSCHRTRSEALKRVLLFLPAETPPSLSHLPASAEPAARAMMRKAAMRAIFVVL